MSEKVDNYPTGGTPHAADTLHAADQPSDVFNHDHDKVGKPGLGNDNESLISDTTLVAHQEGLKPAFLAKANLLNKAIQEIGMGRYQYELFFSGGFGWFADNVSGARTRNIVIIADC